MKLILFLALSFLVKTIFAFPDGAPDTQHMCDSMAPRHSSSDAQQTASPFHLVVSKRSAEGGALIQVQIVADAGRSFKGFYLKALTKESQSRIVGEFLAVDKATQFNFRNCERETHNAVTHSDNQPKQRVVFNWRVPDNFEGVITFQATIVKEFAVYWVNQVSEDVTITQSEQTNKSVYDECGVSKSCIGLPKDCVRRRNCKKFVAVIVSSGTFTFEMQSSASSKSAYIAAALSADNRMGNDSVIECVNKNGRVQAFTSVTKAIPNNYGARRSEINQDIIRLRQSKIDNGAIYCRVERDAISEVDGVTFNLTSQAYYLLFVSGPTTSELSIGYHGTNPGRSRDAIRFDEDNPIIIRTDDSLTSHALVDVHGSFMMFSWIGATCIGVLVARYMQKLWTGKHVFGKDIWFIVHQTAMSMTWLLTIASVTIIWIDVGEWRTSTHSILGNIATVLCFIQPLTVFFKPSHDDDSRPIFNFLYGSVGMLAHFLTVITIFFATSMTRDALPSWTKYILIMYIVIYLIFYAALHNKSFVSDYKERQLTDTLKDVLLRKDQGKPNSSLLVIRRFVFIAFLILILAFIVTLINAVTL